MGGVVWSGVVGAEGAVGVALYTTRDGFGTEAESARGESEEERGELGLELRTLAYMKSESRC
jgi:hypothetical protein